MSTPSQDQTDDILGMFQQQGAADVGLTPDSASMVVANLNANTLPMAVGGTDLTAIDTDDILELLFIIDNSASMGPVRDDLINGFNDIMIPALKGASAKNRQAMIIGGLIFDETVRPIWGGEFLKIDDLPNLTRREYTADGSCTSLYQAMKDGLSVASVYASRIIDVTNTPPKTIIVTLSDGANNRSPRDPADVKVLTTQLSKQIFVLAFAGFETGEPVDFHTIASATGFDAVYEMKQKVGESLQDRQRAFRHLIGTLSSSIIRQSQNVIDPTGQSFFATT